MIRRIADWLRERRITGLRDQVCKHMGASRNRHWPAWSVREDCARDRTPAELLRTDPRRTARTPAFSVRFQWS